MTKVIANLDLGGSQLALLRVARSFAARGQHTRLLVGYSTDAGLELARAHGVEPELMGAEENLQWRCDPAFAAWLEPRLADAEIVHAHHVGAWWAAGCSVPPGVPFAASEHNDLLWPGEQNWDALADVAGRVDRFYAHAPGARAGALRIGVPEERVARGVSPVEGFGAVEDTNLPSPRIVFAARLARDKGPDVLVEAIARMSDPPPVFILGAGVLEPELRARVGEAGLEDVVHLCGWVYEPGPWMAGASVQVCPSRDEAFSQAAALAMALGTPVVGTRLDGFSETLADGRGLIVEPDDPAALAAAFEDVLSGARSTDLLGARQWAQQFDVERVTSHYERDYLELTRAVAA